MHNEWFIIANPNSNSGKTSGVIEKVLEELGKQMIAYRLNLTTHSGEEIKLVEQATMSGFNKILAIGGDGTVQKIVAGIVMQQNMDNSKIVFALIPCGTGNDWAKSKGLSKDIVKSVKILNTGKIQSQDVGVAKIKNGKTEKTRYFVTYSGVGFDSFMLTKIDSYKWLGKFSYLICALMNFLRYKNIDLKVATPKNVINTKIFLLGFGICKYTGGGMQLIKDPAGNDGNLNITIAQEFSKIDIIRNFFNLFNGSIFKERKVLTLVDKTAKISSKSADLVCQGDGEIFGAGKIEYSVVNKGLRYLS